MVISRLVRRVGSEGYIRFSYIRLVRCPDDAPIHWKATVGFVFKEMVVTYIVWERTIKQTSLIVFNSKMKRTVFFKDSEPGTADVVDKEGLPAFVWVRFHEFTASGGCK